MSSQHFPPPLLCPDSCAESLVAKNLLPKGVVQRMDSFSDALGAVLSDLAGAGNEPVLVSFYATFSGFIRDSLPHVPMNYVQGATNRATNGVIG